ncbi:FAD-dependent oxidoreductase [Streptomyces sp. HC307]|uniref:FAD-dependent oxidoreductase n=1 Tax=Streptomyces flavusporus TaxID=3385496 RepID=UPI003916E8B5
MTRAVLSRVVIVGGGPAAAAAAVALRDLGHDGEVVMVSGDPYGPYSRPPLSKVFLQGHTEHEDLALDVAGAEVRSGMRAVHVDPVARHVDTSDGDRLRYDGLVLATGSRPRRPKDASVAVLATLDDARSLLRRRLRTAASAVIVGSGFLAYELASAARDSGAETAMVIRPGALEAKIGDLAHTLRDRAREHGVRIITTRGGSFSHGGVITAEGERLDADLVAAALGTEAETALLPEHSLPGIGFIVDEHCRVAPGIVAACDVPVTRRADGSLRRDVTWTNALTQGAAAAGALLDADAPPFDPIFYGWTEAFGLDLKFAGTFPQSSPPEVVDGDRADGRALLRWPGAAAAIGYRMPVGKLKGLARAAPAEPDAESTPAGARAH